MATIKILEYIKIWKEKHEFDTRIIDFIRKYYEERNPTYKSFKSSDYEALGNFITPRVLYKYHLYINR